MNNIRCLASPTDYHHVFVLPIDGKYLSLWNGSAWVDTEVPVVDIDVFNCTVEGVENQHIPYDVDLRFYAYRRNGVFAVNFSRSQEAGDAASGYQIKPSDLTMRLIGGCHYCSAGGTILNGSLVPGTGELGFGNGAQNNNVGSYLRPYDLRINPSIHLVGGSHTGDTAWWRRTTDLNRVTVWAWGDAREPMFIATGSFQGYNPGTAVYAGISLNGADPQTPACFVPAAAGQTIPFCVVEPANANGEGFITADLVLKVDAPSQTVGINPSAVLAVNYRG